METITEQPSKEQVRAWMKDRRESGKPLPSPQDIRRELGWGMHSSFDRLNREFPR